MSSLVSSTPQDKVFAVAAASVAAGVCFYLYSGNTTSKSKSISKTDAPVNPPHVWSWIPYLGSAIALGKNITRFIRENAQKCGNVPVFTATIMGDTCVFIADPMYLTIVFRAKYSKYLDSLSLQKQFAAQALACNPKEVDETFGVEVNKASSQEYHQYLFKGMELEKSMQQVQALFHQYVPELLLVNEENIASTDGDWVQHDLFDMVVRAIFKATMGPIFSQAAATDEMYQYFKDFDKGVTLLFNDAPSFMTDKARAARGCLFSKLQSNDFWNQASDFMKQRKKTYLDDNQTSEGCFFKANTGLLWASVGNTSPAVFWTLLMLLEHTDALEACRAQVAAIVAKRGSSSSDSSRSVVFTLEELDEMTLLQSAFKESLRLYQGNFSARRVVEDFVLETPTGNYRIPKGSKLMSWWGILHSDPYIFESPEKFQYDRFVDKSTKDFCFQNGKTLTHEPVMPFGGGEQLCPGRKLASYETRLYLAMLMQAFEMKLVDGHSSPGIDPAMAGIGVSHPDSQVKVEIRTRKH